MKVRTMKTLMTMTVAQTTFTVKNQGLSCRDVNAVVEEPQVCLTPFRPATCSTMRGSRRIRTTCWVLADTPSAMNCDSSTQP